MDVSNIKLFLMRRQFFVVDRRRVFTESHDRYTKTMRLDHGKQI